MVISWSPKLLMTISNIPSKNKWLLLPRNLRARHSYILGHADKDDDDEGRRLEAARMTMMREPVIATHKQIRTRGKLGWTLCHLLHRL